ncbi:Tripartite tricarboxylate transporter family receptor [Pigmentiphaga humi]|uniref:Tripartite tricarboxylate transporter family receptor n=1 Tax=Pigmentiphaga humi TaxID=2478468 RepID=A0A3P4B155_9BURK|nr:tripartite tricarboxylate transporter substrate binding protein [Pigmentiphaga humi]VCU69470.1 Tripartite tricarboxylate transporter family receptor [Pigmentiphaga humi]
MKNILRGAIAASLLVAGHAWAQAPAWPAKPLRAVVPYSVGSGPDAVTRLVGEKLAKNLGQPLIVENKPGANGWLAIGDVKRSAADGYSLVVVDNTHMTLQPHLYKKLPFDPVADFEPVAPVYTTNFFIVVPANSPWNNVTDLIKAAKAKGGNMTYGTWGMGSVAHIGASMFQTQTGTNMTHVPFKELPQLYTAVATGEVDWAFGTAATTAQLYQAKKVKLLALAAPKRLSMYADVPTVAEAGGPANFELKTWVALFAPKGTPKTVIDRLNAGVAKAVVEPDIQKQFNTFGFEAWPAAPADLAQAMKADTQRFEGVVRQANISLD